MPTIDGAQENFTVYFQPEIVSDTDISTETQTENFSVYFLPTTEFTAGNKFYEYFTIFTWMPVVIDVCEQLYRNVFHVTWSKYVETEFAEFDHYELHRNDGVFVPAPGDPTLVYQTTDADDREYYDETPDENSDWHYVILCILDDDRYCVSDAIDANHYPQWGVEWPDVLIHNDGSDNVPQNTDYTCESEVATDPEGATVIYRFQYCQSFSTPQYVWTFSFGSNPVPRFIDCEDRRVVCSGTYGVWVAGEQWTLAGDRPADLSGYGPMDKVFIYDEELNFVVFGDGVNGKLPGDLDVVEVDYSDWLPIETTDSPELVEQLWTVGELTYGIDYSMRVFPMDNIAGKRGYADLSGTTWKLLPELDIPILVYPENHMPDLATYWPHFQFYGHSKDGANVLYALEVSDDPTFTTVIESFDQQITPLEWNKASYTDGEMVYFTPPKAKPILSIVDKHGPYYWRVKIYDTDWGMWSKWTDPFVYNVEGATFIWMIGLEDEEIEFTPAKNGWNVDVVQVGRQKTQKKVFHCTMAPMKEDQYELLKDEFERRTVLSLWDNMGENYFVYWGECERALSGRAFFPDSPNFGIGQKNYIPGALRYWGDCTFTEI